MGLKDMLKSAAASDLEETIKESKAPAKKDIPAKKEQKKDEAKKPAEKKEEKKKSPEKKVEEKVVAPAKAVKEEIKNEAPVVQPTVKKKAGRPSYEELGMGEKRRVNKSLTYNEEIFNRAYQAAAKRRLSVAIFIEDAIVKYLEELGE